MIDWTRHSLIGATVLTGLLLCLSGSGCGNPEASPASTSASAPVPTTSTVNPAAFSTTPFEKKAAEPVSSIVGDRQANQVAVETVLTKQTETSPFRFAEIAKEAGIDFVQFSGMTADKHFPTANGSGVALFDYDNDGKLDLFFATGTLLPLGTAEKGPNRLFKNLGENRFKDVTEASGLGFRGFCHGIVVGDVDNDGDQDVFLCNYGPNVLYLNNGDGTFRDVSKAAGIDRPNWSSGGAFLDYDNDGDLDLYIANYGSWIYPEDAAQFCGDRQRNIRLYCSPRAIRTVKHILYRNNGDGTFADVTDASGVGRREGDYGHGFGVVTCDINGDGLIDIYVTNDMNPNFLFLNKGDGTFDDVTESSGAAFNDKGMAMSGMGVDVEDINGDGRPDIVVTNFSNEYNTLYKNLGKGTFMDVTPYVGLSADTTPFVGWGTGLIDFNNDGWPDNFVTNGGVDDNRRLVGQPYDYAEPALLFLNLAGKRFRLSTRDAGPYFESKHVGRGAAFGDLDNDGDVDIVVNHKDSAAAVLRNDTKTDNHWIRLELQGTKSNRDAVGTQVEVVAGGMTIYRQRKGGVSMESANDPRILIGIGAAAEVDSLTLRWPSGIVTKQAHLAAGRTYKLVEPKESSPAGAEPSVKTKP